MEDNEAVNEAEAVINIYQSQVRNTQNNNVKLLTAVIGPALSGKSTVIDFIRDNLNVCCDEDGEWSLKKKDDFTIDKEMQQTEAKDLTTIECPSIDEELQQIEAEGLTIIEVPPIDGSDNLKTVIKKCMLTRNAVNQAEEIRAVFVFPFDMMKNNPFPLFQLLSKLKEIECDVCLIITRRVKGNSEALLKNLMEQEFSNADEANAAVYNNGKKLIKKVLDADSFFDFHAPTNNLPWDREKLLESIKKAKGFKVQKTSHELIDYLKEPTQLKKADMDEVYLFMHAQNILVEAQNNISELFKLLDKTEGTTEPTKPCFDDLIINNKSKLEFGELNNALTNNNDIYTLLREEYQKEELNEIIISDLKKFITNSKLQDINDDFKLINTFKALDAKLFVECLLNLITYTQTQPKPKNKENKSWFEKACEVVSLFVSYIRMKIDNGNVNQNRS